MILMERVKAILLEPQKEWTVIDGESGDATYLLTNYVAILAAVPAVASVVGQAVLGLPIGLALLSGVFWYIVFCAGWYVQGYVINLLAPTFTGQRNLASALKVSAYSSTAAWLAGIFFLIPALTILSIVGLYSLYLLYSGLPVLMKAPREKALAYTAAVVVIMMVIMVIVMIILGALLWPV
jgi:hypothetical protein